jgi:hypothetical protein
MPEITKSLKITPLQVPSIASYTMDVKEVTEYDTLIVKLEHEKKKKRMNMQFKAKDIAPLNSIRFDVYDFGTEFEIQFFGIKEHS